MMNRQCDKLTTIVGNGNAFDHADEIDEQKGDAFAKGGAQLASGEMLEETSQSSAFERRNAAAAGKDSGGQCAHGRQRQAEQARDGSAPPPHHRIEQPRHPLHAPPLLALSRPAHRPAAHRLQRCSHLRHFQFHMLHQKIFSDAHARAHTHVQQLTLSVKIASSVANASTRVATLPVRRNKHAIKGTSCLPNNALR
jgi:hypothetical protein